MKSAYIKALLNSPSMAPISLKTLEPLAVVHSWDLTLSPSLSSLCPASVTLTTQPLLEHAGLFAVTVSSSCSHLPKMLPVLLLSHPAVYLHSSYHARQWIVGPLVQLSCLVSLTRAEAP